MADLDKISNVAIENYLRLPLFNKTASWPDVCSSFTFYQFITTKNAECSSSEPLNLTSWHFLSSSESEPTLFFAPLLDSELYISYATEGHENGYR